MQSLIIMTKKQSAIVLPQQEFWHRLISRDASRYQPHWTLYSYVIVAAKAIKLAVLTAMVNKNIDDTVQHYWSVSKCCYAKMTTVSPYFFSWQYKCMLMNSNFRPPIINKTVCITINNLLDLLSLAMVSIHIQSCML